MSLQKYCCLFSSTETTRSTSNIMGQLNKVADIIFLVAPTEF